MSGEILAPRAGENRARLEKKKTQTADNRRGSVPIAKASNCFFPTQASPQCSGKNNNPTKSWVSGNKRAGRGGRRRTEGDSVQFESLGSWELGVGTWEGKERERVRVLVQKDSKSLVWQGGGKGGWKDVVWVCDCD